MNLDQRVWAHERRVVSGLNEGLISMIAEVGGVCKLQSANSCVVQHKLCFDRQELVRK